MADPTCIVMVGLPATGKSTRVDEIVKMCPDAYIYSTDAILERKAEHLGKTYDEVFEKHVKDAKTEADIWLDEAIKHRLDIIWDQTNLGVGKRRKIVNRMKRAGYQVYCECIVLPDTNDIDETETWKKRLESRPGKVIPDHVLDNMQESFVSPTLEEGFDRIDFYNMSGDLLDSVSNNE